MTLAQFEQERTVRPCTDCGAMGVVTAHNPNNNGLLVRCPSCGSKRPWGSLLYLKQNERRRSARPSLPDGETLDSVWEKFGNRCFVCSAPKHFLIRLAIGRHAHHVAPYAEEGHKGPIVPICTLCHPVVTERQRMHWFLRRVVVIETDTAEDAAPDHRSVDAQRERNESSKFDW
jgi:hypothetical protein